MLGNESPKSITLIRDFWKTEPSPEASISVLRAGGSLHLDVIEQERVAGLASCPRQKGCGPADRSQAEPSHYSLEIWIKLIARGSGD